jgi:hypothetical protein
MRTLFNQEIPLRRLFETPTVEGLASTIIWHQAEQILDELEEMSSEGVEKAT